MQALDVEKWRVKIRQSCARFKFSSETDDVEQQILMWMISGRGRRATISQMVIDCIRKKYGQPGLKTHDERYALATALEWIDDQGSSPWTTFEASRDLRCLLAKIPKYHALLVELYYLDGFDQPEIGRLVGTTSSNVWLELKAALKMLRRAKGIMGNGDSYGG